MVEVKLNHGICGLSSTIKIQADMMQIAKVKIETNCPHIQKVAQEMEQLEIDIYTECLSNISESQVFNIAKKHITHASCPIVSALLKGLEVEGGLALSQEVHMSVNKMEA